MTGAIITAVLAIALVVLSMIAHARKDNQLSTILAIVGIVMAMVSCTRAGGVA